ncbi:MAG: hypothetical protein HY245_09560 [Rhizobiales bacterium]|nr:hypothetical protein [Hyphomicrobiales bacterium]MBI3673648.1 hypothetical protein [Hyphomicrobiales bacterium]
MKTILLIAHLIAIATGTGMSIANYVNIRIAASETGERRAALVYLRRQLAAFADLVIAMIWITGLALWWSLPPGVEPNSWIQVLLAFAVLMTVCHGLARMTAGRMARTGDQSLYPRMELLVSGVWISMLAAIVFAVLAFER